MTEIKCPHCGKVFTVDESGYMAIASQIRDKEFEKELKKKEEVIESQYEAKKKDEEKALNEKIVALLHQLDDKDKENKIAILNATSALKEENISLKNKLDGEEDRTLNRINEEVNKKNDEISFLKSEVEKYKNYKVQLSTKMIGEALEVHCKNEFEALRATAFKNAYFEKDNDAKSGSKGDFIYRDYDDEKTEYISIMFEMKNEADTTATKHKNEDFLKELDKDRREKNCEYAILVSMLEADSELYNLGIVDVSHKYPKMYVIRPQFFIPIITILRNANMNSLHSKKEIERIKSANVDVENFEVELNTFKEAFGKNYRIAKEKFDSAIEEIDKTISHLEKVKKDLQSSSNNLRLANNRTEDLSIKKLTKNSPSLKEKFDELKK